MWWIDIDDKFTSIIKRGDLYYFRDDAGWIYISYPIAIESE